MLMHKCFIMVDNFTTEGSKEKSIFKGVGTYDVNLKIHENARAIIYGKYRLCKGFKDVSGQMKELSFPL